MLPTIHSPLALLFAKIKAEMVANGTPFADASAEIAFRGWLQSAWVDSGCTQEFSCLYQPATSTTVSIAVKAADGHRANVWWGDGANNSYALNSSSYTTIAKTYASGALRPIVVLGKITSWDGGGQSFGGRLWAHLRSLTLLSCGGCQLLSGDIANLPAGLTGLYCWGCQLLTGDIANLPAGLTVLNCGGCQLLSGDIANLPAGLTSLSCGGCRLLSGDIANLPAGLTYLDCWSCQLLTGDIANLPAGLTYLDCGGCQLLSGDIANLPAGLTGLYCGGCPLLYTGARVWQSGLRSVSVAHPTTGVFTSGMTDALIIDTSAVPWSGEKVLNIVGNCSAPTSAADDAIDSLIAQGVTVLTN